MIPLAHSIDPCTPSQASSGQWVSCSRKQTRRISEADLPELARRCTSASLLISGHLFERTASSKEGDFLVAAIETKSVYNHTSASTLNGSSVTERTRRDNGFSAAERDP